MDYDELLIFNSIVLYVILFWFDDLDKYFVINNVIGVIWVVFILYFD